MFHGESLKDAIIGNYRNYADAIAKQPFDTLMDFSDQIVVGKHFSSAGYMDQATPATWYLALKYGDAPEREFLPAPCVAVIMPAGGLFLHTDRKRQHPFKILHF